MTDFDKHKLVFEFLKMSDLAHRKQLRNPRSPAQYSKNTIQKRYKTRNASLFR